ncbi:hypothetical protein I5907_17320 [Panacibacter sp. DH6]|uniref:Uncharacterized protein n=1 Tax=Panacibacter microcysteis TaxID=2793269 RepID=A0A931GZ49_9BACT|nr:hypothetical protein [Panacibacter microcysteis]MBG9378003.1 hypothetical protein [Panacibacter microcysteis]
MELHLKIIGAMMIVLALIHLVFPVYFKWKTEFTTLSLINRQVMYVHTFFIALTVLLMGLLCLTCGYELTHTAFGKKITGGLLIFWFIRLICQFFIYSPALWRCKKFETIIHIIFSMFWIYVCIVFTLAYQTA